MKRVAAITLLLTISALTWADLAAYWNFDDGSGTTVADFSGNNLNAALMATDEIHYPQWTAGWNGSGSALLFNAEAVADPNKINYLYVDPNNVSEDPNVVGLGEAFTIAMWVRRDALTNDWGYLVYTDAYDIELAQDPDGDGDPYDYFWSETETAWQFSIGTQSDAQKNLGSWYHLAITCDNQLLKKYVDGVLQHTRYISSDINLPRATTAFYVASRAGIDRFFTGALDEIAIWSGSYLPAEEVAKLANGAATPLTAADQPPLDPIVLTKEIDQAWRGNPGWKLFWDPGFNWDVSVTDSMTVNAWWFSSPLTGPGARAMVDGLNGAGYNKWWVRNEADYSVAARDIDRYGVEWIDPSWSGQGADVAVIAAYITPGILLCQDGHGYQQYRPELYVHEYKDFFKTYARIAAVSAEGAQLRIKQYLYDNSEGTPRPWNDPNVLTDFYEVSWPLGNIGDSVWKEYKHAFPKPITDIHGYSGVWFELSIVGGNEDTLVYFDEFNPVSNFPNNSVSTGYDSAPFGITDYWIGDFDQDSYVNMDDFISLTGEWLKSEVIEEPRDSGLLANGDFFADLPALNPTAAESKLDVNPAGWTWIAAGPPDSETEKGVYLVHQPGVDDIGVMNYTQYVMTPLGGTVSAYTNDPNYVLTQTTTATAIQGQTYYAMAYVMAKDWNSWKDFAILTLEIDGTEVAVFERALSRNRWRPVYGTYTATAADNGKPITVKIGYDNRHTDESFYPDIMFIGFVTLDTAMPADWPDGRENLLANGGFDEIDWMVGTPLESVYNSIYKSDNWGAWFVDDVPAPPGWIFEVPSGFNEADQGGIWASGLYGTPLPSPGMNDVCLYASEDLVLGQVVGPLQNGMTYYLDMACAVNSSQYSDPNSLLALDWPGPAPTLHLELWSIPAGITDGAAISAAIAGGNPNYVKLAEAAADATGNISGGNAIVNPAPASKWQLIGTAYTATAADTNVYVRVYGQGGAASMPEFAFSDVYLSAEKRLVPGGDITFDIDVEMDYETDGPYTCTHASFMGLDAPEMDLDGNCIVNLSDFAIFAENWLRDWFDNISGVVPYN